MSDETRIFDNTEAQRFELHAGDQRVGLADYRPQGGALALVHTEVDPRHGGHGYGSALVRAALDSARDRGLSVLPHCSFVRDWIGAHPEYLDLVPEAQRPSFGL
ncbi:GNAT family N-acetyltransferase [Saccharopolyspora cebuensis]|uniref:GNAT family N-acetyltransferase n=1 Tax=Saccharopolyspora cebuensis TaxID=418759 RepID=A0ABV4CFV8_9PSEU